MSSTQQQLVSALRFQVEAGVDVALREAPINLFEEAARQKQLKVQSSVSAPAAPLSLPTSQFGQAVNAAPRTRPEAIQRELPHSAAIDDARARAKEAASLDALKEALASYDGCGLKRSAKSLVFADGNPDADLMFIGEAPGRDEDIQGLPFVGRSGQLLNRMIEAIGLQREDVYITNVIPWRPPGNRTPSPEETELCRPFIERHIELISPKIVVFLGGASAKQLLRTTEGIMRLRGKWLDYPSSQGNIRSMATLHPAYLLRSPAQKALAWRDFLAIKDALKTV